MSAAAAQKYVPPIQGHPSEISMTRKRGDPTNVERYIEQAISFVDGQPDERWIDTFYINGDTYGMAVCPCLYPLVVCRAIDGDGHKGTTSRQTTEVMTSFKLKMGATNYVILNALQRKEELMATAQQGGAAAAADPGDVAQVAQRVGPGTPEGSTCLHTQLRIGGDTPTDPPAVIGTQITGQVLQQ